MVAPNLAAQIAGYGRNAARAASDKKQRGRPSWPSPRDASQFRFGRLGEGSRRSCGRLESITAARRRAGASGARRFLAGLAGVAGHLAADGAGNASRHRVLDSPGNAPRVSAVAGLTNLVARAVGNLLVANFLRPRAADAGNLLVADFRPPRADGVGNRFVANFLRVVANRVGLFVGRRAGNLTANRVGNLAVLHFALVSACSKLPG